MTDQPQAVSPRRLRVFLCHASEDKPIVRDLYKRLRDCNIDPWLDEEELVGGMNWKNEIRRAVRNVDVVIVCFSFQSLNKTGFVHHEVKLALEEADQQPEDTIFIIPLKLDKCELPESLRERKLQWINYFEEDGFDKLIRSLKRKGEEVDAKLVPIECHSKQEPLISFVANSEPPQLPMDADTKLDTGSKLNLAQSIVDTSVAASKPVQGLQPAVLEPSAQPQSDRQPILNTHPDPNWKIKVLGLIVASLLIIGSGLYAIVNISKDNNRQASHPPTTAPTSASATVIVSNSYPPKNAHLEVNDSLSTITPGWVGSGSTCQFSAGAFHLHASKGLTSCFYFTSYTNFVYEISMRFVTYDPKDDACGGIAFRQQSGSAYYSFLTCSSGACELDVTDIINSYGRPLYRTEECPSMDKNPNHANLIAVLAQGKAFSVFVNKAVVIPTINDTSFSTGLIGVIVIAQHSEGEVAFNNAKLWTL